jgi:hypothetical protein
MGLPTKAELLVAVMADILAYDIYLNKMILLNYDDRSKNKLSKTHDENYLHWINCQSKDFTAVALLAPYSL